jgi:hypothetical protein
MKPNEIGNCERTEHTGFAPELSPEEKRTRDDGLRILARMIARAYIKDQEKKYLAELGMPPRLFIERIYIAFECVDMNNGKERQRFHQTIDEAINEAARQDLPEKTPFVFKRDGIRIRIYR